MSEQHEEEILRRWAREQAEIERQTDALVLKALTTMVTAAEDLKSKLRRDVEEILEEYRRKKRSLENEISLATAERQRFRREAEQERDAIVAEGQSRAREIVEGAERERESLLADARSKEERLRVLEEEIRSVFGIEVGAEDTATPTPADIEPEDADVEPVPVESAAPQPEPDEPSVMPASPAFLTTRSVPPADEIEALVGQPPAVASDEKKEQPPGAALTPPLPAGPATRPALWLRAAAPEPAPVPPPTAPASLPGRLRRVEMVFDGVPGYQQASSLETAVGDLLPDGDVDIVEFEHGQLVLSAQATDLEDLVNELVSSMPASLQATGVTGDRATFHCV